MFLSVIQLGHTLYNHCIGALFKVVSKFDRFFTVLIKNEEQNISLKQAILEDTCLEIEPLKIALTGTVPE